MEAEASGDSRVYQAGRDQFIFNLPPLPASPIRQIVEGDVPQRPRAFQERAGLLARLHERVDGHGAAVIDAVTGTPGVGKSLLAASYTWACQRARWPVIAWITAESEDHIVTGLAALARRLEVAVPEEDAFASAVRARDWLAAADHPALLVFDNATAVDQVRRWCPATGAARVLITTRNRAFHTLYDEIGVGVFTPDQAVSFLHQRTRLTGPGAEEVVDELGCLPLAVGQAGAYIDRRRMNYPAYVRLLRGYPLDRYLPSQAHDEYPHGTAAAILLSVDQIEQAVPTARDMLELLAVLSEAGVPRTVLYGTTDPDPGPAAEGIDQLLADLADTSLISFSEDGATVLMHRLTNRVLRERAQHHVDVSRGEAGSHLGEVLEGAVGLLHRFNGQIPDGAATWAARAAVDMLVEQTSALYTVTCGWGEPSEELLSLRAWCGTYLENLADPGRAIPLHEQTLTDRERLLGGDHLHTLASRDSLANVCRAAGDVTRAVSLHERNLGAFQRVLGGDHPRTLGCRNNLAYAYQDAGDLGRAIHLFEQNLADRQRVLRADHPDILTSRNNLALAYADAGDLDRAIPLYQRALADQERVLGGDHPDTLTSRSNLALAHKDAGDLDQAITLFEQALPIYQRALGEDHPDTLNCRNNLALTYHAAGDMDQVIPLLERTLADRERVLGDDHPDTLQSRGNLAGAYRDMEEDFGRAIPLLERTLADRERVLGDEHPHTSSSRVNLATAYRAAGDVSKAIPLMEQALAAEGRMLDGNHPDLLTTRNNLAYMYLEVGDPARAIPLYEQVLADFERTLGVDHPQTLTCRNNLAGAYQTAGDQARAIPLFDQARTGRERVLGGDHPSTLNSCNNLANAYRAAGDVGRAIALYEETFAVCERVLGVDHPLTKIVCDNMLATRERANAYPP
ncbi:Tetratricopeptide (TPR) repeat [Streptosporangium canum]|uniref:Tetratricopeptide (TPR) repeat n=2 Tax=Streptosporangium canum TaxID=324952 RepID=A0A1I4ETT1_9ACTN|nr:Tetratricopeptide (TPR) repeat [Streptosporangium canum]